MTFGLVASPPDPDSPLGETVAFLPFWPSVDVNAFRNTMRIGGNNIPDDRLKFALEGALVSVDNDLADWKATQINAGHATLDDVADARASACWLRAVRALATADLMETHRDVTATREGEARAEELVPTAADLRRVAVHAIRDILGVGRTTIELI